MLLRSMYTDARPREGGDGPGTVVQESRGSEKVLQNVLGLPGKSGRLALPQVLGEEETSRPRSIY